MSGWKISLSLVVLGILFITGPVRAGDLTIITPYYGIENNTYVDSKYGIDLEDSEPMKGLYIQSVNTEKCQWNLFLYQTENINYSDLRGFNFTYDYYFGARNRIKNVVGVGMNYLDMNLAGEGVPTKRGPLDALSMDMTVTSYYLRVGRYFEFGDQKLKSTFLPWIGGELDQTRGDGLADYPGPGSASFTGDDDQTSLIAGLNFRITFRHFLQVDLKHSIAYDHDDTFNRSVAMFNLFMTKNLGLSYRYNRQETAMGTDEYSLFGITVAF